jgi:putative transposase
MSEASVSRWRFAWQHGGKRRLKARAPGHRLARLSKAEWRVLGRMLDYVPVAAGFDTEQRMLKRIARTIEHEFGVTYHYRYLERPLKAHGFSVQRPQS